MKIESLVKEENRENEMKFTKNHTLIIKGMAILILCWHHLYWHGVNLPINIFETENVNLLSDVLVEITKVCVALFTMLSGYGINTSYNQKKENYATFTISHIKKLLINYWWIYIPAFVLSFWLHIGGTPIRIYGLWSLMGVRNFLLDFWGLRAAIYSPTLNNTWGTWKLLLSYICVIRFFTK